MISSSISTDNYQLLSHLQSGQTIGADRTGRLYVIDSKSFMSILVQKVFHDQRRIQQIVQNFVIEKLQERQFHDVTSGRNAYLALLSQFAENQLSVEQRASVAFDYYNQRYRDLILVGEESWQAECQVVLEMLDDPNIPSSFKQEIEPEPFGSGVLLKDRAGRKIALQEDHSTPKKIIC